MFNSLSPRKYIAMAIVLVALSACDSKQPVPEKVATNWQQITADIQLYKERKEIKKLYELDTGVQKIVPSESEYVTYIEVLLKLVDARQELLYGDTYGLLSTVESYLKKVDDVPTRDTLLVKVAEYYINISLIRRAYELVQKITDTGLLPKKNELIEKLEYALQYLQKNKIRNYSLSIKDTVKARLLDLLVAPPSAAGFDEFEAHPEQEEPVADNNSSRESGTNEKYIFSGYRPLLASLYSSKRNRAFNPDEEEGISIEKPVSFEIKNPFKAPFVKTLKTTTNNQVINNRKKLEELANVLCGVSYQQILSPNIKDNRKECRLSAAYLFESTLVVRLDDLYGAQIAVLKERNKNNLSVTTFFSSGSSEIDFRDVTGDGKLDLVGIGRAGSGRFMDLVIYEIERKNIPIRIGALYRGEAAYINLDNDDALELVISTATSEGHSSCNQCARNYVSYFYDYNDKTGKYEIFDEKLSSAELLVSSGYGFMGVTPDMIVDMEDAGKYTQSTILRSTPASDWTPEFLASVMNDVELKFNILVNAQQTERASSFMAEIAAILDENLLIDKVRDYRDLVYYNRVLALINGGNFVKAKKIIESEDYDTIFKTSEGFRIPYISARTNLYLMLGELGKAYQGIQLQMSLEGKQLSPELEGTMAWYFELVGDYSESYRRALLSFDKYYLEEGGSRNEVQNMVHIISALIREKKYSEALDWCFRAIKMARSYSGGEKIAWPMLFAADIAIESKEPHVAIALLDEALITMYNQSWWPFSSEFLILYSKAFTQLGDLRSAEKTLLAAERVGLASNSLAIINAQYELAKMYEMSGNKELAKNYALKVLNVIGDKRKDISTESHKFSFLAERKSIALWGLNYALQHGVPPDDLFNLIENWKMRVFLDANESSRKEINFSTKDYSGQIKSHLQDADTLLSYVISDEGSFAIIFSKAEGPKAVSLNITPAELEKYVHTIKESVNLQNTNSLANIRKKRLPESLKTALEILYEKLIEPLNVVLSTKKILISTDEHLIGIPWKALRDKTGVSLIDRLSVIEIESAGLALWLDENRNQSEKKQNNALLVGMLSKVVLDEGIASSLLLNDSSGVYTLPPLKSAVENMPGIIKALSTYNTKILADTETVNDFKDSGAELATPKKVLEEMEKVSIVHVIAHGLYNYRMPMKSMLFLADGDGKSVIEAQDLTLLNLKGLEVISLAACETEVSQPLVASESIGFLRALYIAGANSVILTGWKVDDKVTSIIFREFYENLSQYSKAEALRQAQLSIKEKYTHPFYWAGISIHGIE